MKIQKKLSLITTALMATALSISATAFADDAYAVKVDEISAAVGETITVSVVMDTSVESVGSVSMSLIYDTESFEYQEGTLKAGKDVPNNWSFQPEDFIPEDSDKVFVADGSVQFAATSMQSAKINSSEKAEIATASFKVLKMNGDFNVEIERIYSTSDTNITSKFSAVSTTLQCSHKNTEAKTTPSTCTVKGKEETVCKDCGETVKTEELPLAEHSYEWDTVKDPTCTEAGEKKGVCSVCGNETTEEIAALGHDWGEWKTVSEPTTEKEGSQERECKRCGEKETKSVPKLEDNGSTDNNGSADNNNGSGDDINQPTGIALLPLPALIASAAVIISKKRSK